MCGLCVLSNKRGESREVFTQIKPLASFTAHCDRWPLEKGLGMRFSLGDLVLTDWEMVILQKGGPIWTSHCAP